MHTQETISLALKRSENIVKVQKQKKYKNEANLFLNIRLWSLAKMHTSSPREFARKSKVEMVALYCKQSATDSAPFTPIWEQIHLTQIYQQKIHA